MKIKPPTRQMDFGEAQVIKTLPSSSKVALCQFWVETIVPVAVRVPVDCGILLRFAGLCVFQTTSFWLRFIFRIAADVDRRRPLYLFIIYSGGKSIRITLELSLRRPKTMSFPSGEISKSLMRNSLSKLVS